MPNHLLYPAKDVQLYELIREYQERMSDYRKAKSEAEKCPNSWHRITLRDDAESLAIKAEDALLEFCENYEIPKHLTSNKKQ